MDLLKLAFGSAGIVVVVLTPFIVYLQRLLTSNIEKKQHNELEKIRFSYAQDMEALKSKYTSEIEQQKSINNSLSGVYLSSNQERVNALKETWSLYLKLKSFTPTLVSVSCNFLTKDSIKYIKNFNGSEVQKMIREFSSSKYIQEVMEIYKAQEFLRPFIGLELWNILQAYNGIVGRIVLETGEGLREFREGYYWLEDRHLIDKIILKIISLEKLNDILKSADIGALNSLLNYLELEIVENINSQLTGKKFSLTQVNLAIELSRSMNSSSK